MDDIIITDTSKTYKVAPAGTHQAVCVNVARLGELWSKFTSEYVPKVSITWAIYGEDGEVYYLSKWYTASLNEKSKLRHDLTTWRGRPFTPEELRGFRLNDVVGANCFLSVVHETTDDGSTKAKVAGISALPSKVAKISPPEEYVPPMMPAAVFAARYNIKVGKPRPGEEELLRKWEEEHRQEAKTDKGEAVPF